MDKTIQKPSNKHEIFFRNTFHTIHEFCMKKWDCTRQETICSKKSVGVEKDVVCVLKRGLFPRSQENFKLICKIIFAIWEPGAFPPWD